jgi:flagellar basal-body rod protein FlgB
MRILGNDQSVMEAALQVRSMRADLLAENVANADTPNFLQRDIRFDAALQQALQQQPADGSVTKSDIAAENLRVDGNSVDLNQQLGQVYENSLNYLATLRLYSDSVGRIRSATGNG